MYGWRLQKSKLAKPRNFQLNNLRFCVLLGKKKRGQPGDPDPKD